MRREAGFVHLTTYIDCVTSLHPCHVSKRGPLGRSTLSINYCQLNVLNCHLLTLFAGKKKIYVCLCMIYVWKTNMFVYTLKKLNKNKLDFNEQFPLKKVHFLKVVFY